MHERRDEDETATGDTPAGDTPAAGASSADTPAARAPAGDTPAGDPEPTRDDTPAGDTGHDTPAGDPEPARDDPGAAGTGQATPAGDPEPTRSRGWSRRRVLQLAGAGGLAGASSLLLYRLLDERRSPGGSTGGASATREVRTGADTTATTAESGASADMARWSDPATWGGNVPGPGNIAVVEKPVLLDVDAEVDGVRVTAAGELVFDPAESHTLRSTSNVVVEGTLRMAPDEASTEHRLVFEGVDEAAFVGDHAHAAVPTDVGLWAVGDGVIDLAGAPKTAWTHAAGSLEAGASSLEVDDATGWREGDEIVVTPTEPATVEGHMDHHDRRVVRSVDGSTVTLDRPLAHPHPAVTVRRGVTHRAEVLNLTRNVRVEGTETGRAHVMVMSTRPQSVSYTGLRHLGPQQDEAGVVGRYALHFHMVGEGSRGSVVEGAVAYDGGNHAFVPHLAEGVTFRDCIAHDMAEDPYWWDLKPEEDTTPVPSHDITFERCVAHYIRHGSDKYGLAGFLLGTGSGNVARGCVAVAILGVSESAPGFHWASHSLDEEHTWVFEDNLAHNNANSGIYFWQNNVPRTIVDRFTVYHCTQGIVAGAYTNLASYRDCTIYACTEVGLFVIAQPGGAPGETVTYEGLHVDQAGLTDYAVEISDHLVDTEVDTVVSGCTFSGGTKAQVGLPTGGVYSQLYTFDGCTFEGNELWLADDVPASTRLRVIDPERGSIVVRRADQPGERRPEWNAAVSPA